MKVYEFVQILQDAEIDVKSFLREEGLSDEEEKILSEKNLKLEWHDSDTGSEGYLQFVVKLIADNSVQYFGLDAYRDSWSGTLIESPYDFYEVKPVQKTITVWEAVK